MPASRCFLTVLRMADGSATIRTPAADFGAVMITCPVSRRLRCAPPRPGASAGSALTARRRTPGQHALPGPDSVKAGLTPKRRRRQVENDEYGAFVRRVLRAYARRVGDGDVEALVLMANLADEIDTAIAEAVKGLRGCGYSWAEIGARLGITRQAAQQRWGANSSLHDNRAGA